MYQLRKLSDSCFCWLFFDDLWFCDDCCLRWASIVAATTTTTLIFIINFCPLFSYFELTGSGNGSRCRCCCTCVAIMTIWRQWCLKISPAIIRRCHQVRRCTWTDTTAFCHFRCYVPFVRFHYSIPKWTHFFLNRLSDRFIKRWLNRRYRAKRCIRIGRWIATRTQNRWNWIF